MPIHSLRSQWKFVLGCLEETLSLGQTLAGCMDSPGVAALFGGLGTGKTTLVQALGRTIGIDSPITSPSYTIVNRYTGGRLPLVHVDCYRIESELELGELGLDEIFYNSSAVVCVEWSEHAAGILPQSRCEVHLSCLGGTRRGVNIRLFDNLWPGIDTALEGWIERNL